MRGGYLTLGRWRGIPLRIHFTTPLGALLFGGFRFAPGMWLGFLFLVVLHELGHAALVRRFRLDVLAIEVHALGGLCRWQGVATPIERAVIAWGGVWAQLGVFAVAGAGVLVFGWPSWRFGRDLVLALLAVNASLMLLNLVPVRPLDGAEAWPLVGLLMRRRRRRRQERREIARRTSDRQRARAIARETAALDSIDERRAEASPEIRAVLEHFARIGKEASRTQKQRK